MNFVLFRTVMLPVKMAFIYGIFAEDLLNSTTTILCVL